MTAAPISLATLPQATAQQVFTQVARHLLTQGATSYGRGASACAYRGQYGMRCAAGCLIADDEWDHDEMEGLPWQLLVHRGLAPIAHEGLIAELQHIHDEQPPSLWRDQLAALGESLGLQMPEVQS